MRLSFLSSSVQPGLYSVRSTETIDLAGWSSCSCTLVSVHAAHFLSTRTRQERFHQLWKPEGRSISGMQMTMTGGFI